MNERCSAKVMIPTNQLNSSRMLEKITTLIAVVIIPSAEPTMIGFSLVKYDGNEKALYRITT
jgi:hypothetical protein